MSPVELDMEYVEMWGFRLILVKPASKLRRLWWSFLNIWIDLMFHVKRERIDYAER